MADRHGRDAVVMSGSRGRSVSGYDDQLTENPSRSDSLLRMVLLVLILVPIGAGSALVWRWYGSEAFSTAISISEAALQANASATSAAALNAEQKIDRLAREVEALKQGVDQIGALQRQLAQSLAAVAAGQDEIRQQVRRQSDATHWLSDPGAFGALAALQRPAPRNVRTPAHAARQRPAPNANPAPAANPGPR